MTQGKKGPSKREVRRMRTQQIIFATIAIIVILSWVIALVSK
jgi:hypothetical protein